MNRAAVAALVFAAIGCDRSPGPSRAVVTAQDAASPLAGRPVFALGAFNLSLLGDGALLVWADERRDTRGIHGLRLDARGKSRGTAIRVAPAPAEAGARVIEVVAASSAELTAVGWVSWSGRKAQTFAVSGDVTAGNFGPPTPLGEPSITSVTRRGRIALAARPGAGPLAFFRGAEQACHDRGALDPCTSFGFRALEPTGPLSRGLPLSVPDACDTGVSGLAVAGERWHYGLCAMRGGRRMTTVFSIEPAQSYARVDEVLPGCIPLGMARVANQVIVGGDCKGEWQGARLPGGDHAAEPLAGDIAVTCERGAPTLRSGDGRLTLQLNAPSERLEALLPPQKFGLATRAVWTGQVLLVAVWDGTRVSLHADICVGDRLTGSPIQ